MSRELPSLSVVIASKNAAPTIVECLDSLQHQRRSESTEVIVADGSADETREIIQRKFPAVNLLSLGRTASLPVLWGAGISRARGDIIAITDATCVFDEGWSSEILKSHESPHAVIAGAVEPGGWEDMVSWGAYFCDYGQFMLPLQEGIVTEIPGNNLSVKRWALTAGERSLRGGFWKTFFCWELQTKGIALLSKPSIIVSSRRAVRLDELLMRRYTHARCFAGMRIQEASRVTRALRIALSPALPALFLYRLFTRILPKRRYRKEFVGSLPIAILAVASWAQGELTGYSLGPGTSCAELW